jgi:hypothetical protein
MRIVFVTCISTGEKGKGSIEKRKGTTPLPHDNSFDSPMAGISIKINWFLFGGESDDEIC